MKTENRKVLHVDGKTHVIAKGRVINGEFVGEYKLSGMTYGVNIPEFNPVSNNPEKFVPLEVKLQNGDVTRAYYTGEITNTYYLTVGANLSQVEYWRYLKNY